MTRTIPAQYEILTKPSHLPLQFYVMIKLMKASDIARHHPAPQETSLSSAPADERFVLPSPAPEQDNNRIHLAPKRDAITPGPAVTQRSSSFGQPRANESVLLTGTELRIAHALSEDPLYMEMQKNHQLDRQIQQVVNESLNYIFQGNTLTYIEQDEIREVTHLIMKEVHHFKAQKEMNPNHSITHLQQKIGKNSAFAKNSRLHLQRHHSNNSEIKTGTFEPHGSPGTSIHGGGLSQHFGKVGSNMHHHFGKPIGS